MVREYIFGEPFETYAGSAREGITTEATANLKEADIAVFVRCEAEEILKQYGGITWDDSDYVMAYSEKLK